MLRPLSPRRCAWAANCLTWWVSRSRQSEIADFLAEREQFHQVTPVMQSGIAGEPAFCLQVMQIAIDPSLRPGRHGESVG